MSQQELVIGQAAGYSYTKVEPFLRSLKRRKGYQGDITWFVLGSDHELQQRLIHEGVLVVPYRNQYPFFTNPADHGDQQLEDELCNWHPVTLRFLFFEAWLKRHGQTYKHVLHEDTRNVIYPFSDPFEPPDPTGQSGDLERAQIGPPF